MVHYKLTYFPHRGAGEVIRQVFALAGQEFEDERIPLDKWPELKAKMPFGQMPVLEEDGKVLGQSYAITRYLARKFGFAGTSPWEEAQVDALADQWKDFLLEIVPYLVVFYGARAGDLEKLNEEVFVPAVKKHFPFFVNAVKKSGSGFLVGNSVTYVDLHVAEFMALFDEKIPQLLDGFPELRDHKNKIHAISQIKKWRETRPESAY